MQISALTPGILIPAHRVAEVLPETRGSAGLFGNPLPQGLQQKRRAPKIGFS